MSLKSGAESSEPERSSGRTVIDDVHAFAADRRRFFGELRLWSMIRWSAPACFGSCFGFRRHATDDIGLPELDDLRQQKTDLAGCRVDERNVQVAQDRSCREVTRVSTIMIDAASRSSIASGTGTTEVAGTTTCPA